MKTHSNFLIKAGASLQRVSIETQLVVDALVKAGKYCCERPVEDAVKEVIRTFHSRAHRAADFAVRRPADVVLFPAGIIEPIQKLPVDQKAFLWFCVFYFCHGEGRVFLPYEQLRRYIARNTGVHPTQIKNRSIQRCIEKFQRPKWGLLSDFEPGNHKRRADGEYDPTTPKTANCYLFILPPDWQDGSLLSKDEIEAKLGLLNLNS